MHVNLSQKHKKTHPTYCNFSLCSKDAVLSKYQYI